MKIIVVSEEDHGDILYAESYGTAIKALIAEGWIDGYTELSTPFGEITIADWFGYGEDWLEKLIEKPETLNSYSSFCLGERYLYLDKEME